MEHAQCGLPEAPGLGTWFLRLAWGGGSGLDMGSVGLVWVWGLGRWAMRRSAPGCSDMLATGACGALPEWMVGVC